MTRTLRFHCPRAQVQSLVREIKFHKLCCQKEPRHFILELFIYFIYLILAVPLVES